MLSKPGLGDKVKVFGNMTGALLFVECQPRLNAYCSLPSLGAAGFNSLIDSRYNP